MKYIKLLPLTIMTASFYLFGASDTSEELLHSQQKCSATLSDILQQSQTFLTEADQEIFKQYRTLMEQQKYQKARTLQQQKDTAQRSSFKAKFLERKIQDDTFMHALNETEKGELYAELGYTLQFTPEHYHHSKGYIKEANERGNEQAQSFLEILKLQKLYNKSHKNEHASQSATTLRALHYLLNDVDQYVLEECTALIKQGKIIEARAIQQKYQSEAALRAAKMVQGWIKENESILRQLKQDNKKLNSELQSILQLTSQDT